MAVFDKAVIDNWTIKPLSFDEQISDLKILINDFVSRFTFPDVNDDTKTVNLY